MDIPLPMTEYLAYSGIANSWHDKQANQLESHSLQNHDCLVKKVGLIVAESEMLNYLDKWKGSEVCKIWNNA
jgi:hypothetical protein